MLFDIHHIHPTHKARPHLNCMVLAGREYQKFRIILIDSVQRRTLPIKLCKCHGPETCRLNLETSHSPENNCRCLIHMTQCDSKFRDDCTNSTDGPRSEHLSGDSSIRRVVYSYRAFFGFRFLACHGSTTQCCYSVEVHVM